MNQRRKIMKGSKDQIDTLGTLSSDKAGSRMEKQSKVVSFPTKIKLCKLLVLSPLLDGCESWTLTVDLQRRIQALKTNATAGCLA